MHKETKTFEAPLSKENAEAREPRMTIERVTTNPFFLPILSAMIPKTVVSREKVLENT